MALGIEVLVESGFLCSAGVHGYDGDAALLVHISTDGVAVVALVHEGERAGPQVLAQQGLGLIVIGDIGAGEDEAEWITQSIAGEVDLGGKAGLGPAHGLGKLAAGRTGPMGVDAHGSAVDEEVFIIALRTDRGQQCGPKSGGRPATETGVDALPRAEANRQIPPGRSGAQALVGAFPATPVDPAQAVPVGFNFFSSSQCSSRRTNLTCWFTA